MEIKLKNIEKNNSMFPYKLNRFQFFDNFGNLCEVELNVDWLIEVFQFLFYKLKKMETPGIFDNCQFIIISIIISPSHSNKLFLN